MRTMTIRIAYLLILCVLLSSCDDPYDAEDVGAQYCECLKVNDGKHDFDRAGAICDAKLIAQNRYYKILAVDMRDRKT